VRFGSVCSGIEAASVAWGPLGWKAAWFSEIEPFPSAVLGHHYPEVKNLGDMTQIPALIKRGEVEAPDILCGGTPCQAFSVAGLRRSLDDARGNLSLTFCEIANAIDSVRRSAGMAASIVFWENVPGVLSTKDNAFGCFLAGLAGEDEPLVAPGGKWTDAGVVFGPARAVAWRTLDAQYFGVAQRRKRVFVVASARDGFDPAAVLLEFDGVRRDSAPSREAGQRVANSLVERLDRGGGNSEGQRLIASQFCPPISPALKARDYKGPSSDGDGDGAPLVAHSLTASRSSTQCPNEDTTLVPVAFDTYNQTVTGDTTQTLCSRGDTPGGSAHLVPAIQTAMQVRRLTPEECERLQGFPDGYTNIPWRGKSESPDGPRYKALGNSWAVPVVRWIGQRIDCLANLV
jgi:DNA (cytosine-5)-methyltransferase 1